MRQAAAEARTDPDLLHEAPVTTPVRRLDEARAARHLKLRWGSPDTPGDAEPIDGPARGGPFAYRVTKDGRVLIDRGGRTVRVVAGKDALALASKLALADADGVQQLLARATGNYRRGTER